MKCKYCGNLDSKVIDSRVTDEGTAIRRRRECGACGKRFTTYEIVENMPILVVKNDKTREPFDYQKIKTGITKACEKRPVSLAQINSLVMDIEKQIYNSLEQEVSSSKIGEMIMAGLKNLDEVAYIRFASVYRKFADVTHFIDFINGGDKKE